MIKLVWRSLFIVGVDLGGYMRNVVFVSFTFFTWSVLLYLSVLFMLYVTLFIHNGYSKSDSFIVITCILKNPRLVSSTQLGKQVWEMKLNLNHNLCLT